MLLSSACSTVPAPVAANAKEAPANKDEVVLTSEQQAAELVETQAVSLSDEPERLEGIDQFFGESIFYLSREQAFPFGSIFDRRLLAHDALIFSDFSLAHRKIIDEDPAGPGQVCLRRQSRFANSGLAACSNKTNRQHSNERAYRVTHHETSSFANCYVSFGN